MAESLLTVEKLSKNFGGLRALSDLSCHILPHRITSVIGPNGAGKTTLFNLIAGYYGPTSGEIRFEGRFIANKPPYQLTALGIARTFQTASYFSEKTVQENLVTASHIRSTANLWHILARTSLYRKEDTEAREESAKMMEFLNISSLRDQPAQKVPTAVKQLLAIGMALMTKPRLLLLDEPSSGMTVEEVERLMLLINRIRERNITVMLIEHRMRMVMGISDHIVVLNFGEKIAEGTPDAIRRDRSVIEAYLGKEYVI